jgi:hypothetical protein
MGGGAQLRWGRERVGRSDSLLFSLSRRFCRSPVMSGGLCSRARPRDQKKKKSEDRTKDDFPKMVVVRHRRCGRSPSLPCRPCTPLVVYSLFPSFPLFRSFGEGQRNVGHCSPLSMRFFIGAVRISCWLRTSSPLLSHSSISHSTHRATARFARTLHFFFCFLTLEVELRTHAPTHEAKLSCVPACLFPPLHSHHCPSSLTL